MRFASLTTSYLNALVGQASCLSHQSYEYGTELMKQSTKSTRLLASSDWLTSFVYALSAHFAVNSLFPVSFFSVTGKL
jgi:hypothetical protein